MSTITYEERWTHPTTADVYSRLDVSHCHRCGAWATDIQAWLTAPNTVQGQVQLDSIGAHILAEYPITRSEAMRKYAEDNGLSYVEVKLERPIPPADLYDTRVSETGEEE